MTQRLTATAAANRARRPLTHRNPGEDERAPAGALAAKDWRYGHAGHIRRVMRARPAAGRPDMRRVAAEEDVAAMRTLLTYVWDDGTVEVSLRKLEAANGAWGRQGWAACLRRLQGDGLLYVIEPGTGRRPTRYLLPSFANRLFRMKRWRWEHLPGMDGIRAAIIRVRGLLRRFRRSVTLQAGKAARCVTAVRRRASRKRGGDALESSPAPRSPIKDSEFGLPPNRYTLKRAKSRKDADAGPETGHPPTRSRRAESGDPSDQATGEHRPEDLPPCSAPPPFQPPGQRQAADTAGRLREMVALMRANRAKAKAEEAAAKQKEVEERLLSSSGFIKAFSTRPNGPVLAAAGRLANIPRSATRAAGTSAATPAPRSDGSGNGSTPDFWTENQAMLNEMAGAKIRKTRVKPSKFKPRGSSWECPRCLRLVDDPATHGCLPSMREARHERS